jgi:dipeptidyl aminopeptidase/acylaminoacyl peptidase
MEAECGRPQWVFGLTTYAFLGAETVALCSCRNGVWSLLSVDRRSGAITRVDTPFTDLGHYLAAERGRVFVDAGGPTQPLAIVSIEMATGDVEVVRSSTAVPLDPGSVSKYRSVTFASGVERASGDSPGEATAHGFFYAPRLDSVQPLEDERPPLLVRAHGGPTSAASTALDPIVQYWTSRGIAVLDVNYGGSTGYGRDYRRRLDGEWGVVDVADCVAGARALAERGDVDGSRLLITGGSAGGFVVLCALAFHETFAAGASHYGVADIETLARDTHKFEARYFDGLIGPYPGCADLYRKRSPIHSVENINSPVILFQGVDDLIVPANQAETMFAALRARGMVCAYLAFPGEQHGFRQRSTIEKVMEAELYFYARVLGFEVPAELQPIDIVNL